MSWAPSLPGDILPQIESNGLWRPLWAGAALSTPDNAP